VLTAVNPDVKNPIEAQIAIRGARVKSGSATVLSASDIHAHNTFEQRQAIVPKTAQMEVKGGAPVFRFPAASVAKLTLDLE
jgi:alpha-N-arabinofuranosidase